MISVPQGRGCQRNIGPREQALLLLPLVAKPYTWPPEACTTSVEPYQTVTGLHLKKTSVHDVSVVHATMLIELLLCELLYGEGDQGKRPDRLRRIQTVFHELPDGGVERFASLPKPR